MWKKLLIALAVVAVLLAAGAATAYFTLRAERPEGRLDTELAGVSLFQDTGVEDEPEITTTTEEEPEVEEEPPERCWPNYGGDPRRSLAIPRSTWAARPSRCGGATWAGCRSTRRASATASST